MLSISFKAYRSKKNRKLHLMINTSAWIWNHCIALQKRHYSLYKKYINVNRLQKHIAKLRNKNVKWKAINAQSVQEICQRVDAAYNRFFKKLAKRPPKFKKAKNFKSFVLKQNGWSISENKLTISKVGIFKFSKSRHYENIKRISVKRDRLGDIYFIFCCDMKPNSYKREGNASVGMDFGLKTFLTCSDGTEYHSPQFFKQHQKKVARANRLLSKKKKGSNNRKKANANIARVHKNIANKRKDFHWKLAHEICKHNEFVSIEDLNIAGMQKLWGKKISDLAFGSFVLILCQVAAKYGTEVQKIGRFYPSSKTCGCGVANKELSLRDRIWTCASCGTENQRDLLAANNILSEGIRLYRTECKTSLAEDV